MLAAEQDQAEQELPKSICQPRHVRLFVLTLNAGSLHALKIGKTVFRDRMRTGPSRESSPSMLAQSSMSAKGPERLFPVGSILVQFALASRRVRRAQRYSRQGHERSAALRQRTSAAPPGQTSAYLCIPLSSLLMPCAYACTIERRREVFILAATPRDAQAAHNFSLRKRD